ncbi:Rha family transcriptional regulator [Shewanella sp. FJAT-51649]|uniref:Rha family transcriptional regulator n=1 Tax=Shewanella sp. FJAT-51649 TaxID=2864210 RepID=UPI001C660545|nr:Rha family transcriptional regulator [Shewanella sp. FJAT-51649]QYJ72469.1 Rha family transcriptional regulator [Shewanella sp. FJAT-51649]
MTTLSTTITSAKASDLVFITKNNQLVTNSLKVAEYFGKQHHHVCQKINNLECSADFLTRNFSRVQFEHRGNQYDSYQMTKDGFIFLVMGFTGKRAAEIKEAYINAFNEMQRMVTRTQSPFERNRMVFTWEGGKIVSAQPLDDDHLVTKRDRLALIIQEPGFLSLEQLIAINDATNERIASFARLAEIRLKQAR